MSQTALQTQRQLLAYFRKYKVPYTVAVDGNWGPRSIEAVRVAKLCLGWKPKYADGTRSLRLYDVLRKPSFMTPTQQLRGLAYRRYLRAKSRRKPTEPLRLRAFHNAEALVGVTETGDNSGPTVNKIIFSGGGWETGLEWCGLFVSYCYRNAGYKRTTWRWMRVFEYGTFGGVERTNHPKRGDLVRFEFGHIGMFDRWIDQGAGTFATIEGNTVGSDGSQGVRRKTRKTSDVLDFLTVN